MSMIVFDEISKKYNEPFHNRPVNALNSLSLEVHEGEVFGFLGPNGAGKSTAIKILLNLVYQDSGSVSVIGRDVVNKDVRKLIGYLPENPYFYDHLTARELLWFGGKTSGLSKEEIHGRTETLLRKVNLEDAQNRPLKTYSKGMVQRAGLALSLIHDPSLLIFDEPMSGLDPLGRKMVGDLIAELKNEGKTVFFSSHILADIERICDRVGIIVNGGLGLVERLDKLLSGTLTLEQIFLNEVTETGEGVER